MKINTRAVAFILTCVLLVSQFLSGLIPAVQAETSTRSEADAQLLETNNFFQSLPSAEDDWDAFAFYLIDRPVSQSYVDSVKSKIDSNQGNFSKTTDLAKTIIGLRAAGQDPTNFQGINLIEKLYNRGTDLVSASNDAAWALIALDSSEVTIPADAKITREYLIQHLVEISLSAGGWTMNNSTLDADITGMVMTALGPHQEAPGVSGVLQKAADQLKEVHPNNSNSIAQMILGLTAVGIDPASTDYKNLIQQLLDFAFTSDNQYQGQFRYNLDNTEPNTLATQQSFFALEAYRSFIEKGNNQIFYSIKGSVTDKTVNILPLMQRVEKGETIQLEAEAKIISGEVITGAEFIWSSSDSEIAEVNQDGVLTAKGDGTVTITVQLASDEKIKSQLKIIIEPALQPTINVTVEGPQSHIAEGQVQAENALQALEKLLIAKEIAYDPPINNYISSIANIVAGTYGGWDGWSFIVKRGGEWINPDVGMADFKLQTADQLFVYYGDSTAAVQSIGVSPAQPKEGEPFTVTVQQIKWDWVTTDGKNYTKVEQSGPALGATVTINGTALKTNENGQATFSSGLPAGNYNIELTSYQENKAPILLRASQPLYIEAQPRVNVTVEGPQSHIAEGQVQAENALQALEKLLIAKEIAYDPPINNYISSIANIVAGTYGGWDGWSFIVKRGGEWINPDVGMADFKLQTADQLFVYYGDSTAVVKSIKVNPVQPREGELFTVSVEQVKWDWITTDGKNYTKVEQSGLASGVTVTINGTKRTTDENGQVTFSSGLPAGNYNIEVTGYQSNKAPAILRASQPLSVISESDSSSPSNPVSETVTISITGDDEKGTILSRKSVEIESGDTVYDILIKAIGSSKVNKSGSGSSIYIYEIDGLNEFDRGPESGWMFSVNGEFIEKSSSSVRVYDGDEIKWKYTSDLGKDIDAPSSSSNPVVKPAEEVVPQQTAEEKAEAVEKVIENTVDRILNDPYISDWEAFVLAKVGIEIPATYIQQTEKLVQENNGVFRKITDIERIVLAVNALGYDPTNFAGYNLLESIYNAPSLTNQGTNGLIFALVALDNVKAEIPEDAKWTREKIISMILDSQYENGGIPLAVEEANMNIAALASDQDTEEANIDITAMALAALAPYQDNAEVKNAIEKGVQWLSDQQLPNGGYQLFGEENSSSISQTIIALTALGIDPKGEDFTKENGDLVTRLLDYQTESGGFKHLLSGQEDAMATEQALMAVAAYERFLKQEPSLYYGEDTVQAYRYSDDLKLASWAKDAVYQAKEYGLMEGYNDSFNPKESLTRAQFTKMLVSMLGEQPSTSTDTIFDDVKPGSWYEGYVTKAREKGMIQGFPNGEFKPDAPITRQQIAVMIARAFSLKADSASLPFPDVTTSDQEVLAAIQAMVEKEIMIGTTNNKFSPNENVSREMAALIAVRLYENDDIK